MVILLAVANLVVFQYVRGATQLAVDNAARHGSSLGRDAAACVERGEETLRGPSGVLRGVAGDDVVVRCRIEGSFMVAVGEGVLRWWLPGIPDARFVIESRSVLETAP